MGIYSIFNVAKTAMAAAQASIQLTSHNIANVNTEGYVRQEVILEEAPYTVSDGTFLGNGVTVQGVMRHYDRFLDDSIALRNGDVEKQTTLARYLEQIEGMVSEDNSKLLSHIVDFFNSWQELSTDCSDMTLRMNVAAEGEAVCQAMRSLYANLETLRKEVDRTIGTEVDATNRILAEIVDINRKIYESATSGVESNDLVNERTNLYRELSGKLGITYAEDQYGRITITTTTGKTLIDSNSAWALRVSADPSTNLNRIMWEDGNGHLSDITTEIATGTLAALVESRDEYIGGEFMGDVDALARSIVEEVNGLQQSGYSMEGVPGVAFFVDTGGSYAREMAVSAQITGDPELIATSISTSDPLNNEIALRIAELADTPIDIGRVTASLSSYAASLNTRAGEYSRAAREMAESAENMMDLMEAQRASVSGVSIDEEMTNLMKYQYAYQAAARLVNVADEMLQTILQAFR